MFKTRNMGRAAGAACLSAVLAAGFPCPHAVRAAADQPAEPADVFSFRRVVTSVAFAPDGKTFVTGGGIYPDRGELIWWDLKTGKPLRVIRKHRLAIWSVAFAPDGKAVASAGDDGDAKIWDAATGELLCDLVGHTAHVLSVSFSADGTAVVTTGDYTDMTMWVWDARTGKPLRSFQFPKKIQHFMYQAALTPDAAVAVVGSTGAPLRFFRVATGKELEPLEAHGDCVVSVLISPDGKTLITGGDNVDKTVRVWDLESRHERLTLKGHSDTIMSLSLSADGKRLASGSCDHTARVWDLESGKEIAVLKGHTSMVRSVALSPDGKTVVTAGDDHRIRIWDAESGEERTAGK